MCDSLAPSLRNPSSTMLTFGIIHAPRTKWLASRPICDRTVGGQANSANNMMRPASAGSTWCSTSRHMAPYSQHQQSLGRPLSPHITVYKQPITAVSSIASRLTGIALAIGFAGVGGMAAGGMDVCETIAHAQATIPGFQHGAKFLVAYPCFLHGLGGIRHLVWDRAPDKLITDRFGTQSSKVLLASAVLLALGSTAITIQSPVLQRGSPP